jgi:peptide/nickel transport system substrate-binding protein
MTGTKTRAILLGLAALAGCTMLQPAYAGPADNSLNWISRYPIDSLDPYYNTAREAIVINGQLVFDTLVWRDPESGEYLPLLAKSWTWVDDTTLDFELRDDVKWHNGEPLTADDAVYTYNRVSAPDANVPVPSYVNWIAKAEKTGDHSFRLVLAKPFPAVIAATRTAEGPVRPQW